MAAFNQKCFEKKCICSQCEYICSRCFVSDTKCNDGIKDCDRFKKMKYNHFVEKYVDCGITNISEEIYNFDSK